MLETGSSYWEDIVPSSVVPVSFGSLHRSGGGKIDGRGAKV